MRRATPFAVAAFLAAGCGREEPQAPTPMAATLPPNTVVIDGINVTAQPGATIEYERTARSDEVGGIDKSERASSGSGSSLVTSSGEVAATFHSDAPTASFGNASGGGSRIDARLKSATGVGFFVWLGAGFIVGAAGALYFGRKKAAMVMAGLGGVFIAAGMMPGWAVILIGLGGAAAVGVLLWTEYKGERSREALRAVVAGVEALPAEERVDAKASIGKHADDADRATIRKVKRADGFGSER